MIYATSTSIINLQRQTRPTQIVTLTTKKTIKSLSCYRYLAFIWPLDISGRVSCIDRAILLRVLTSECLSWSRLVFAPLIALIVSGERTFRASFVKYICPCRISFLYFRLRHCHCRCFSRQIHSAAYIGLSGHRSLFRRRAGDANVWRLLSRFGLIATIIYRTSGYHYHNTLIGGVTRVRD